MQRTVSTAQTAATRATVFHCLVMVVAKAPNALRWPRDDVVPSRQLRLEMIHLMKITQAGTAALAPILCFFLAMAFVTWPTPSRSLPSFLSPWPIDNQRRNVLDTGNVASFTAGQAGEVAIAFSRRVQAAFAHGM